ncbi:MAG: IS256 family transposase [Alphaproteobacteria bacterium]|nr:IS256 family transposase [Alphaproteobacteria bacterium]
MNKITKEMKKSKEAFKELVGTQLLEKKMEQMIEQGKRVHDGAMMEIGRIFAETLMIMDRDEMSGEDYQPIKKGLKKWGFQKGSIYIGNSKVGVNHPRLRENEEEVPMRLYERLKKTGEFSDEILAKALRGLSGRKYGETVGDLAQGFGISASSISNRFVEAGVKRLREFQERDLSGFKAFAIFLDTVHRGGSAFIVALGLDQKGKKRVLGLWEGATENAEIAKSLLSDLESRGFNLSKEIIFVTDGGKGIIRALKDRFLKDLLHQRCTIHKDRNIQSHLPKRYRQEAHRRFRNAMDLKTYEDAKKALDEFKGWLLKINESSAKSLEEAGEELLTLHRLNVSELLRKTLHSTNAIESIFSTVRHCEKNIKRYRSSKMSQRWLTSVLLYAEENFRTVKGYNEIPWVIQKIKIHQRTTESKVQNENQEILETELASV